MEDSAPGFSQLISHKLEASGDVVQGQAALLQHRLEHDSVVESQLFVQVAESLG